MWEYTNPATAGSSYGVLGLNMYLNYACRSAQSDLRCGESDCNGDRKRTTWRVAQTSETNQETFPHTVVQQSLRRIFSLWVQQRRPPNRLFFIWTLHVQQHRIIQHVRILRLPGSGLRQSLPFEPTCVL
jgi:hypothetical protein